MPIYVLLGMARQSILLHLGISCLWNRQTLTQQNLALVLLLNFYLTTDFWDRQHLPLFPTALLLFPSQHALYDLLDLPTTV